MQDDDTERKRSLDSQAVELYDDLRGIARRALARAPGRLDPTELVHQAWIKMSRRYEGMPRIEFLALCATIIRRIAVDEARKGSRERRALERITLTGRAGNDDEFDLDLLALDEALEKLRKTDERWARIVELRYFGGLTGEELGQAMGLSRRTVTREWTLARSWLKRALG